MEDDPLLALPAYIRSKIRIFPRAAHASKVFASEIMHGAPHLPKEYLDELNAQAQRNAACRPGSTVAWLAPVDRILVFAIWAATQTYAPDFDWQISIVTGSSATPTTTLRWKLITRLVLKGCTPDGQSGKSAGRLLPL